MPNKYCNLTGLGLIKDEYDYINQGFEEVENDVNAINNELDNKVDKVSGKDLSSNDFTNAYKNKLDGIEAGAEVNNLTDEQADSLKGGSDTNLHYHSTDRNRANHTGTQTASTISDFAATVRSTTLTGLSKNTNAEITSSDTVLSALGKLQKQVTDDKSNLSNHINSVQTALNGKVDKVSGKDLSTNDFTNELKEKLNGIEEGAEKNNLTDEQATGLTSGSNTSLHYHSADRNRANHTGTQPASTISDFAATVRSTTLTGLSKNTNAEITSSDSVLSALGKLQKQVTDDKSNLSNHINSVQTALNGKVDKVSGKGLSTNDYTNEEKQKLANIPENIEITSNKNKPNGYLGLDEYGKFDETMGKRFGIWTVDPQRTTVYVDKYTPTNIIITTNGTEIINDGANSDVVTGTQFVIINKSNESVSVLSVKGGYPSWVVPSNTILKMFRTDTGWAYANIPLVENNFIFEKMENKGEANGYAPLDNNKLIPAQYIPQNALFQSYANTIVGDAEGSTIDVTDVQDYTNARGLTIEGKAVEKPIKNRIPESALKFEQGIGYEGVWRPFDDNVTVTITQNQTVTEWNSTTATRIQTTGGLDARKYRIYLDGYGTGGKTFRYRVKIKNVGTSTIVLSCNNGVELDRVPPNTTKIVDADATESFSEHLILCFGGLNASDNLDFYAESPLVAEYGKTPDNPYEIIGVGESGTIATTVKTPNLIPNGETVYETTLPAPLHALSDSKKDYVDITEGKIYKITNKIVCDGSENWGLTSSQPSDNSLARFGLTRSDFALQALGIYSHGDWFGGNMFLSRPEGAGVTSTQIVVHIAKARIQGWDDSLPSTQKVSLFKNWLSAQALIGRPVTFVYELATPTVTDITPQTVPLYAPTTNITTNDELQPTIRLTYNRDSNKVIEDLQNQINQLKSAIALL